MGEDRLREKMRGETDQVLSGNPREPLQKEAGPGEKMRSVGPPATATAGGRGGVCVLAARRACVRAARGRGRLVRVLAGAGRARW